ncbi:ATP-binding protein [Actinophytocola sp. NPDC049390]|uniref:ATP-binding protein n=1 Tax=Actinophytocola sp. NPDC049390 TaxID=3363894 RepID=UPI0037BCA037
MHKGIEIREEIVVLAPKGRLDAGSGDTLRDRILAAAADEPRAVLVDVTELELPAGTTLFTDVADQLAHWPGVPLFVVDPRGRLPGACPTVRAAIASVGDPPPRRVAHRVLPGNTTGGRAGRAFVRDCCRRWHIEGDRADAAVWVANELIENTIRHTPYAPAVRVELRRGELTVAVRDDDPQRPRPDPEQWPLHGLAAVHKLATAWGTVPVESGGKVVWAAL